MASSPEEFCPHLSIPVEMDESMTSSSLNIAWPVCQKCSLRVNEIIPTSSEIVVNNKQEFECSDACLRDSVLWSVATPPELGTSRIHREHYGPNEHWNVPREDEESLELPLPLRSDMGQSKPRVAQRGPTQSYPHNLRCPPPHLKVLPPQNWPFKPMVPMAPLQATIHGRDTPDVITEKCVFPSQPNRQGHVQAQEVRRTISLPDDCRTVFITYSVDVAEEIFPFVTFLINQGFRTAIDIFDNAVRQMDVNKWMDGYLKDKSVLIIMVISPKYKIDIDGDGLDQHGLHTKYIHTQLQNEFIQQRCLNFRLVPVLFPNANQSHIPLWLRSTRVFRWPHDAQDLLLRLLREERYIAPPLGPDLTVSIRPL